MQNCKALIVLEEKFQEEGSVPRGWILWARGDWVCPKGTGNRGRVLSKGGLLWCIRKIPLAALCRVDQTGLQGKSEGVEPRRWPRQGLKWGEHRLDLGRPVGRGGGGGRERQECEWTLGLGLGERSGEQEQAWRWVEELLNITLFISSSQEAMK